MSSNLCKLPRKLVNVLYVIIRRIQVEQIYQFNAIAGIYRKIQVTKIWEITDVVIHICNTLTIMAILVLQHSINNTTAAKRSRVNKYETY